MSAAGPIPYDETLARGYVVGCPSPTRHGYAVWSWHYGRDHAFGTTSGTLDFCVAVYASRAQAQAVADLIPTGRRNYTVQTLREARRLRDRQRARAEERRARLDGYPT